MFRILRLIMLTLYLAISLGAALLGYAQNSTGICDSSGDYAERAVAAYDAGDYEASLPAFYCALGADPLNHDLRRTYMQAQLRAGQIYSVFSSTAFFDTLAPKQYDIIAAEAEAALAANPNDEDAAMLLTFAHYPILQEDLDRFVAINPDSAIAYIYMASKAAYQDSDPEAAIAAVERALELAPDDLEVMAFAASLYSAVGEDSMALDLTERILEANPAYAPAYFDRAFYHLTEDNIEAALTDVNRAVEIDPFDYRFYNLRADLLSRSGDNEAALADYQYVLDINPGSWSALLGVIDIGLETGDDAARARAASSFQTTRADVQDGEALVVDAPVTLTMTAERMFRLPLILAEGEVTITAIAADPDLLDPMLMVVDPGGAAVAWNDDVDVESRDYSASVTFPVETAGEYLVLATHSGAGSEGEMTVSVSIAE